MRSIVVMVSLNEAEATGSPLELVQAHDHPLHLAALAEELVDLLLRCVEAHVAHIERGAIAQERGVNIIPSRCDKKFSFLSFCGTTRCLQKTLKFHILHAKWPSEEYQQCSVKKSPN